MTSTALERESAFVRDYVERGGPPPTLTKVKAALRRNLPLILARTEPLKRKVTSRTGSTSAAPPRVTLPNRGTPEPKHLLVDWLQVVDVPCHLGLEAECS
jgi:hypothetical protein